MLSEPRIFILCSSSVICKIDQSRKGMVVNCKLCHNLISNLPSKLKCYIYKFLFLFKILLLLFDFRKSEKERMREYQRELEEREEKLKHRPLLFQRVAQVVFVGI